MNPDVSRALAAAKAALNLSRPAARKLLEDFGDASSVADLPLWIRQVVEGDDKPDR